jgi:hypothetical protein
MKKKPAKAKATVGATQSSTGEAFSLFICCSLDDLKLQLPNSVHQIFRERKIRKKNHRKWDLGMKNISLTVNFSFIPRT